MNTNSGNVRYTEVIKKNRIDELEKLKVELEEYSRYTAGNDLVIWWEDIEEVFKDRLSELKGEQE